jgi:uncharacterized tellurite resistance protein B-like protein
MFGSIKTLISALMANARPRAQAEGYDGWLATAALLTRVATVHREMSEARQKALHTVLKSHFGLDDHVTARLVEESAALNRNAIDLYHFTRQLNEILDDEGRRQTVRMMWEVVYADGSANEYEANLIWRAADLLGVSSRQRVELRQRVSADNAAAPRIGGGRPPSPALATTIGN